MQMKIRTWDPATEENTEIVTPQPAMVLVEYDRLADQARPHECAQIDVVREDGSIQRFWVGVKALNRGAVECTVTALHYKKDQNPRKTQRGTWWKKLIG